MKPRIFIGSSWESLPIAKKVEGYLLDKCECVLWPNAFSKNKSNLDSLIFQTKVADFSILIAMPEDMLHERGVKYKVARDNVVFEFGLFLGAGGIDDSFLVAEESIDLPSDLDGITISKFSKDDTKYNALQNVCSDLLKEIEKTSTISHLGLLPSTALAIGYYYSFIKKVCEELHSSDSVIVNPQTDPQKLSVKNFHFRVIIPEDLDDNGVDNFRTLYNKRQALNNATTGAVAGARGYPFVFKLEPPNQDMISPVEIHLYDVPTTLNTIVEAIRLHMPTERIGKDDDLERIEKRELVNFAKTLRFLISKNTSTKDNVTVEEKVKAK